MKYYFFILGCQMNIADAERIAGILDKFGFKKTDSEKEADIIIVLACSVRQSAIDRIYGKINLWHKEKRKRKLITLLTGCLLPKDRKNLKDKFDLVFHIEEIPKLPELLKPFIPSSLPSSLKPSDDYLCLPPKPFARFRAYIPIMTGCNNFCTYCVVPYTRGPERSRPTKDIIKSYGHQKGKQYKENKPFIKLLKAVNELPGEFWIHFISNHPKDMTKDLVREIAKLEKVAPYIHLPLQSGDNEILKKMNRHYSVKEYLELIKFIRKTIPSVAITTDIIVGFPGETKEQFKNTLKTAKKAQYDLAFTAQYSERPGTPAAKLKDNVSPEEKARREKELTEVIKESALKNNEKLVNTYQKVLVDGKKGEYYFGRTNTWKVVKFKSSKNYLGQFINLKIKKAEPWKLIAEPYVKSKK